MSEEKSFDLTKVHEVNLKLLKEIDRICRKYKIKYALDSGTLLGEHYVGGIVGQNEGSVIRCRNDGDVNITEVKTTVAIHEVNLTTIRSTESVPACTDIGGIAGASSGILQSCTNNGDVGYEHVGYNVGGITGRQSGWTAVPTTALSGAGRTWAVSVVRWSPA